MVALLIRRSVKDVRIGMNTLSIVMSLAYFVSPILNFGNERGTGAEMRPAIVSGIVTGNALSLVTVPEVFANVSSIQFSSRS